MSLYSSIIEDQDADDSRGAMIRMVIGETCQTLEDEGYHRAEIFNSLAALLYAEMVETLGQKLATERWFECCRVMNNATTH